MIEEISLYKKVKKSYLKILESVIRVIILEMILLSFIAIVRIPVGLTTVPVLLIIAMLEIIRYFSRIEEKI